MKIARNYRYNLDPSSRKIHCPDCGKKTFVGMIDKETGEFLPEYGKCDREVKCGYSFYPYQNGITNNLSHKIIPVKDTKEPSFHLSALVKKSFETDNNLLGYFRKLFGEFQAEKIQNEYKIGTCTDFHDGTIFWQIDEQNRIHGGKIICYNEDGRRTKNINWIHSILKKKSEITEFNLQQCLFGLHHISEDAFSTIAIVESEKTACIMSVVFPQFLWMACGAKSEFKMGKLLPIQNRKIIAYPDCEMQKNGTSTYDEWKQKAEEMNTKGFDITVSDLLETSATEQQKIDGIDLADFFMK